MLSALPAFDGASVNLSANQSMRNSGGKVTSSFAGGDEETFEGRDSLSSISLAYSSGWPPSKSREERSSLMSSTQEGTGELKDGGASGVVDDVGVSERLKRESEDLMTAFAFQPGL